MVNDINNDRSELLG